MIFSLIGQTILAKEMNYDGAQGIFFIGAAIVIAMSIIFGIIEANRKEDRTKLNEALQTIEDNPERLTSPSEREQINEQRRDYVRAVNRERFQDPIRTSAFAAAELDMNFSEVAAVGDEWEGGSFGKINSNRIARDIIYGFHDKFPVVMFNYSYMRNGVNERRSVTGVYTSCMMPLINVLAEPDPGRNTDKLETESTTFNETFKVEFDKNERELTLRVITPVMMDYLLTSDDAKTEFWIERGWMFTSQDIIHTSYGDLDDYIRHLGGDFKFMTSLARMFPPYLAKERENPRLALHGIQNEEKDAAKYALDLLPSMKV